MNYYIQGNAAKADKIRAAFEMLGYKTIEYCFNSEKTLYFTFDGAIKTATYEPYKSIIKTHPDYKELELPIEPNFKVGDWYLCVKDFYGKGVRFDKGNTYHCGKDGCLQQFDSGAHISIVEELYEYFRLWTIADAKGGDVLISDKGNPFIFCEDRIHAGFHNIIAYCGINTMGSFCESSRKECWTYGTSLKPATKEQRDLLFAKMREAGYEWDAVKKELKKNPKHYDIKNFHAGMPVLVRDYDNTQWRYVQFSHCVGKDNPIMFNACGNTWKQCIPFNKDTEHLLGTTDMPSEEYINW